MEVIQKPLSKYPTSLYIHEVISITQPWTNFFHDNIFPLPWPWPSFFQGSIFMSNARFFMIWRLHHPEPVGYLLKEMIGNEDKRGRDGGSISWDASLLFVFSVLSFLWLFQWLSICAVAMPHIAFLFTQWWIAKNKTKTKNIYINDNINTAILGQYGLFTQETWDKGDIKPRAI